jgi:hypothetical protein
MGEIMGNMLADDGESLLIMDLFMVYLIGYILW